MNNEKWKKKIKNKKNRMRCRRGMCKGEWERETQRKWNYQHICHFRQIFVYKHGAALSSIETDIFIHKSELVPTAHHTLSCICQIFTLKTWPNWFNIKIETFIHSLPEHKMINHQNATCEYRNSPSIKRVSAFAKLNSSLILIIIKSSTSAYEIPLPNDRND